MIVNAIFGCAFLDGIRNHPVSAAMASKAAANIGAKDQVTLDYRFVKVNSPTPLVAKALKAKAKNDCEDVFTNLIEQAAGQILEASLKK